MASSSSIIQVPPGYNCGYPNVDPRNAGIPYIGCCHPPVTKSLSHEHYTIHGWNGWHIGGGRDCSQVSRRKRFKNYTQECFFEEGGYFDPPGKDTDSRLRMVVTSTKNNRMSFPSIDNMSCVTTLEEWAYRAGDPGTLIEGTGPNPWGARCFCNFPNGAIVSATGNDTVATYLATFDDGVYWQTQSTTFTVHDEYSFSEYLDDLNMLMAMVDVQDSIANGPCKGGSRITQAYVNLDGSTDVLDQCSMTEQIGYMSEDCIPNNPFPMGARCSGY